MEASRIRNEVVYENKEGLCCSSRRLIGHQEAAALSGLTGAHALDSQLVTGGFPKVVRTKMIRSLKDFLADQLADDGTPSRCCLYPSGWSAFVIWTVSRVKSAGLGSRRHITRSARLIGPDRYPGRTQSGRSSSGPRPDRHQPGAAWSA